MTCLPCAMDYAAKIVQELDEKAARVEDENSTLRAAIKLVSPLTVGEDA